MINDLKLLIPCSASLSKCMDVYKLGCRCSGWRHIFSLFPSSSSSSFVFSIRMNYEVYRGCRVRIMANFLSFRCLSNIFSRTHTHIKFPSSLNSLNAMKKLLTISSRFAHSMSTHNSSLKFFEREKKNSETSFTWRQFFSELPLLSFFLLLFPYFIIQMESVKRIFLFSNLYIVMLAGLVGFKKRNRLKVLFKTTTNLLKMFLPQTTIFKLLLRNSLENKLLTP